MAAAQRSIVADVAMDALRLFCYIFSHKFLFNPHFDLEPDYIIKREFDTELNSIPCIWKYCQFFTHESIIDQYAISALHSSPNCPFPFDDHHQNLIHPYRARPHSPSQTASGSDQPFCYKSHVRTDRWDKRLLRSISALLSYSDSERCANNC